MRHPDLSIRERAVRGWLVKNNIPFVPVESKVGCQHETGGPKVNFLLPGRSIILRVREDVTQSGQVVLERVILESEGDKVVDIWAQDDLAKAMTEAVSGREITH